MKFNCFGYCFFLLLLLDMLLLDHLSGNASSLFSRKNGCWMNLYKSAEKETIEALHRLNVQPVDPHWGDLVLSVSNIPILETFRPGG